MYFRLAEATFVKPIAPQLIVRVVTPFERRDTVAKVLDLAPEMQDRLVLRGFTSCEGQRPGSSSGGLPQSFSSSAALLAAKQKGLILDVPVELPQHPIEAIPIVYSDLSLIL